MRRGSCGPVPPGRGIRMSLTLLDWRRRVARLYAEVRSEPDTVAAQSLAQDP